MTIAKQFLIYGIGSAASRFAAILLVPLYTRALSVADYGQLEVLLSIYALTILLAGLQSESAVARDYFEAKAEGTLPKLAWGAALTTFAGSGLLILGAIAAQAIGWIPADSQRFVPLLLAMTVPSQILGIQFVMLRFAGAPLFFALLSFLDLCLCALFSVALILGLGLGIEGALAGILFGKTICALLAWPRTFGSPRSSRPSMAVIKRILAYSLPTMPAVLLNWLQTNGSRLLLAIFLSLSDVALAGVAMKVAALYFLVVYSFRLAWEPYSIAKLTALKDDPQVYNRAFQWYILTMFPSAGGAILVSPLFVSILAPAAYADAASLTGFFIIGQFWIGASAILCIGIHGARVTSRLTYAYAISAAVSVLVLVALVDLLGYTAAAIGFMIGAMVAAALSKHYSEVHFNTGFSQRLMVTAFGTSAILGTSSCLLHRYLASGEAALADRLVAYSGLGGMIAALLAITVWLGFEKGRIRAMLSEIAITLRPKAAQQ